MAHVKVVLRYAARANVLAPGHARDLAFSQSNSGYGDIIALLLGTFVVNFALDDCTSGRKGAGENDTEGRDAGNTTPGGCAGSCETACLKSSGDGGGKKEGHRVKFVVLAR